MKAKKIPVLAILAAFIFSSTACAGTVTPANGTTAALPPAADASATTQAAEETTENPYESKIQVKDFGGAELRFTARDESNGIYLSKDIYAEKETGEPINDAVYMRNKIVEEKFNVHIRLDAKKSPTADSRKSLLAGDDAVDVIVDCLIYLGPAVTEGLIQPLESLPTLDIQNRWWDQSLNSGYSIANRHYFLAGDMLIGDNEGTFVIMANKKLMKDYNLENIYDLVNSGNWTIDKMYEMARAVSKDLNGDSEFDERDQWGLLTEVYHINTFTATSGAKIAVKNADDIPEFYIDDPLAVTAFQKAYEIMADSRTTILSDTYATKFPSTFWQVAGDDIFNEGRALFYLKQLANVPSFRNMETDFGLIPIPKYSADQKQYYSTVTCWLFNAAAIPVTNTKPEMTGTLLEALSYESIDTLTKAYFDICLKNKLTRDEESVRTLDIILQNRSFDLAMLFNWNGVQSFYMNLLTKKQTDVVSAYEKEASKLQIALQKTLDEINKNA